MVRLRTAGLLLSVTLAIILCLHPTARSQDGPAAVTLKTVVEAGDVVSASGEAELQLAISYGNDGQVFSATRQTVKATWNSRNWFAAVENGRPTTIWRSYAAIEGTQTQDSGDGNPIPGPYADARAWNTFVLQRTGNSWKLVGEPNPLLGAADLANAINDSPSDLLPGREVSAGDSWEVPAAGISRPSASPPNETLRNVKLHAKLVSVEDGENGVKLASIAYSGSATGHVREVNQFDPSLVTETATTYEYRGTAVYETGHGRLQAITEAGTIRGGGSTNGMQIGTTGKWSVKLQYRWSRLLDGQKGLNGVNGQPIDNGSEGPAKVDGWYTAAHENVAGGHVIIARSSADIARLQVFDPATGKIVKTLAALPGQAQFHQPALSPDRQRVAVRSNANNLLSIATHNVFVVETAPGKVNQVTPEWATNDGLGQPVDTGSTGTIRGRVEWLDGEFNRVRSDGLSGSVRIDHTRCAAIIGADGRFELTNVPAGTAVLLVAQASFPPYSNGAARAEPNVLFMSGQGSTVAMVGAGETKDIGAVRIHPPQTDHAYGNPVWTTDGLLCQFTGSTRVYRVGYPQRQWSDLLVGGSLELLVGGLVISPDRKLIALTHDTSGGAGGVAVYDANGKAVWSTRLRCEVGYDASAAWLPDGTGYVVSASSAGQRGNAHFGVPTLLWVSPANKQVAFLQRWPEWAGSRIESVAVDAAGERVWFVVHRPEGNAVYGDLYVWDATTDTTRRLTSLGDLTGVADCGR